MESSQPEPQTQPSANAIPPYANPNQKTSQPPTGSIPPVNRKVVIAEKHQNESHHCRPDQTPIMKLVLEVLGVAILAAYTVAAFKQLGIMSEQITEMKNARIQSETDNAKAIMAQQVIAQTGLVASQKNFEESSKNSENAFRDEQRAWVGALNAADVVIKEGEVPSFRVLVTNSGKTPALHLRSVVTAKSRPKGQTAPLVYPPLTKGQLISDFVLQPNAQYSLISPPSAPLTKLQADLITSGDMILWIFGKIRYQDASRRVHHTKFCFVMSPDLKIAQPCNVYNEAD